MNKHLPAKCPKAVKSTKIVSACTPAFLCASWKIGFFTVSTVCCLFYTEAATNYRCHCRRELIVEFGLKYIQRCPPGAPMLV